MKGKIIGFIVIIALIVIGFNACKGMNDPKVQGFAVGKDFVEERLPNFMSANNYPIIKKIKKFSSYSDSNVEEIGGNQIKTIGTVEVLTVQDTTLSIKYRSIVKYEDESLEKWTLEELDFDAPKQILD